MFLWACRHKWHSLRPTFLKYCKTVMETWRWQVMLVEMERRQVMWSSNWPLAPAETNVVCFFPFYSAAIMQSSNQICKKVQLFSVSSHSGMRAWFPLELRWKRKTRNPTSLSHTHICSLWLSKVSLFQPESCCCQVAQEQLIIHTSCSDY